MKTAVAYIRISSKDQSNFSIPGQKQSIDEFCKRKGITLLNEFVDNGQSAKNFDRGDWKKLESFVKQNHKTINHLVVIKYDRFSRNVSEGLLMIDKLEKKYGITVLSVNEDIALPPESPFFFMTRTNMLVQADFELRVITQRVNEGIKTAKRQGRFLGVAPLGYINKRDSENKPIIEIDPEKEKLIKEIFQLWNEGFPVTRIAAHVKDLGFVLKGNSALTRILKNPVYAGFITHKEQTYKGIHQPIIDLNTFNRAQNLFKREEKHKVFMNDEIPLKGVLRCQCGKFLTAGKSKGKIHYYWYYKCSAHLQFNYSAKVVDQKLKEILDGLSISDKDLTKIKQRSQEIIKKHLKESESKVPEIKRRVGEFEKKILETEEKFMNNQITHEVYLKWNATFNTQLNEQKELLKVAKKGESNVWEEYESEAERLKSLFSLYSEADTMQKQKLLNIVFNYSLKYQLNTFMCEEILPIFAANSLKLKEKGLLEISNPLANLGTTPVSTGGGSVVELFKLVNQIHSRKSYCLKMA